PRRFLERLRDRLTGNPDVHRAVIDGIADAQNLGRGIGRIAMCAGNFQIDGRASFDVIEEDGHGRTRMPPCPGQSGSELRSWPLKRDLAAQLFLKSRLFHLFADRSRGLFEPFWFCRSATEPAPVDDDEFGPVFSEPLAKELATECHNRQDKLA